MFISSVYLLLYVGFAFCATDSDAEVEQTKLPLVGPEGEKFNDAEVVDCEFVKEKCEMSKCHLNETASTMYNKYTLPMQPGCDPVMKSVHDYYTEHYQLINNMPTPFTSSFTGDLLTGMEFHTFIKKPDNKSVITFMSFDETHANYTDVPFVLSILPQEKILRFNSRKDKKWCVPQDVPYEFPDEYWVITQVAKCDKAQCFRVYAGPRRDRLTLLYTAYARTLLKKYDFWSVMSDPSSTLEAAFWQKPSTGRETITILRDGLSNGQPIMVRGEVVEPQIKVRFTLKDGSHKDVTVETKNSNQIETLFFEVSDKCMLQSYKTLPYGKKKSYPGVDVIGATKFEVLSGMKVRAIEIEQCARQYKKET